MKKTFSWKVCVSFCVAISFFYIGITGILSYGLPYSGTVSALHTLFGVLFIAVSLLHLKTNWNVLMSYLVRSSKKTRGYRKEALTAVLLCLLLTFGAATRMPPLGAFLEVGDQLRTAQTVEQESYQRIYTRLGHSSAGRDISVDIRKGPEFSHKQPLFLGLSYTVVPQMAIWVEDTEGNYLETLYVTEKAATGSWEGPPFMKEEILRTASLPYWAHKRGVVGAGGHYLPSQAEPLPDAVTAATPTGSFALFTKLDGAQDELVVLMEVNKSYDYNSAFSEEALGDVGKSYAEKTWAGQPALVYAATITLSDSPSYQVMRVIGHSDPRGESGELSTDLSGVDSALKLVDRILVELPEKNERG